jgi:hypothetical protein
LGGGAIVAIFRSAAAFAADISRDKLKFAPGIVKDTGYNVANSTSVYSDHAF